MIEEMPRIEKGEIDLLALLLVQHFSPHPNRGRIKACFGSAILLYFVK